MKTIRCYTSGNAQGNPGPAAIDVSIIDETGSVLASHTQAIGNSTSNFAAYNAVMVGFQMLVSLYDTDTKSVNIVMYVANEVVKQQLNAELQITEPGLVPMFIEIHNMCVVSFPHRSFIQGAFKQGSEGGNLMKKVLDEKE